MAQWKRAGPITQRSVDRNYALLIIFWHLTNQFDIKDLRWPGIEPGSTAWKAAMLTTIPPTLIYLNIH